MASILFAGAAGEVTGSRHLLEVAGKRLLLDCGLFQGHRQDADRKNRSFLFDPAAVDAVILSHAHLDHCGDLPRLVKQGFKGKIYCSAATADLAMLILEDSARIQQQDASFFNRRHPEAPIEPLYHDIDVAQCRNRFVVVDYGIKFAPVPGVDAWLHEAGHILGSAQVSLKWEGGSLLFSGDLGRHGAPLLKDPWHPSEAPDTLILESTYGDRRHTAIGLSQEHLGNAVNEAVARGGKVIIPAFAVGRAQELIYELEQLRVAKKIPAIPVFVDSPMASRATRLFDQHQEILDREFQQAARVQDPFRVPWIQHTESVEASKAINAYEGSCVIISASGMCESGRILHHLMNNLQEKRNMVLIVGFQAEGTLGRRLVDGQKRVLVYGAPVEVNAEIRVMNEYSAHADCDELLEFVRQMGKPGKIYLVHGEARAASALKEKLAQSLGLQALVPALGAVAEL
ncbi:MAG: MBL fold metallo-hydrolase [candidate division FCPU426 bacterium]